MSLLVKSPRSYAGSATLPAASSLTLTYAKYASRVAADGGVILDPTECEAAFNFLVSNSVNPAQFVVSPRFGIKHSAGEVLKLYSFDGNDMVSASTGATFKQLDDGPYLYTGGAFPVVHIDGVSSSKYLRAIAQKPLLKTGATGFCMACSITNDVANDSLHGIFAAIRDGATNLMAAEIIAFNNDNTVTAMQFRVADSTYNPDAVAGGGYQEIASTASYAAFAGLAGHLNMTTKTANLYVDGVGSGSVVAAPDVYAYAGKPVRLYFGASLGPVIGSHRKSRMAELWHVNDCTAAFALALSARLGTMY